MSAYRNPVLARHALDRARPYGAPLDPVDVRRDTRLRAWIDLGNGQAAGEYAAHRALDDEGRLGWAVEHPRLRRPVLDFAEEARAAIATVEAAERERARAQRLWGEVRRIAGHLRRGEMALAVPLEASREGLAPVLHRAGVRRLPGRLAGWLMLLDPRLGFAIWMAHRSAVSARAGDGAC